MKRAIGLASVIIAGIIAFFSVRELLPFVPAHDSSGIIITIIAFLLLALFLYRFEIQRGLNRLYHIFFSPVLNEEKKINGELIRKIEAAEKKMDTTEKALLQFSSAIADYANHLASHTSAIQGLSQASHELKKGAAEQNRVLSAIMENIAQPLTNQELSITVKDVPLNSPKYELQAEKSIEAKILPFHKALYKTRKTKPFYKIERPVPGSGQSETVVQNPVPASKQPTLKDNQLIFVSKKPKINIDGSSPIAIQPEPVLERLMPFADKLVISARKSLQRAEEIPEKLKHLRTRQPEDIPVPPGCARRHEDQLWY